MAEKANGGTAVLEGQPAKKVREPKPPVIPTPSNVMTGKKPLRLLLHVGKEFLRTFRIPNVTPAGKQRKSITCIPLSLSGRAALSLMV
jgi:hypothetical protein